MHNVTYYEPLLLKVFHEYILTVYSEHDIITVENENIGLKFTFICYKDHIYVDTYYAIGEVPATFKHTDFEKYYFWSEPITQIFFHNLFSFEDIEKIKNKYHLKNIFRKK